MKTSRMHLLTSLLMLAVSLLIGFNIAGCEKSPTEVPESSHEASQALTKPAAAQSAEINAVREIGAIGKPASVAVRDGGASAIIGGKLLWYFADTIFRPRSVDGVNLRANTAALADPATPLIVNEPLDANGAPYQFVPFTPEEQAYNESSDDRIALWPGSVVPNGQKGIVFYSKWKILPGPLNYEFIGTGIASVKKGKTVAVRAPRFLFNAPEPSFDQANLIGSYVYVYGRIRNGSQFLPVGVARVPLEEIGRRSAYRFWNGSDWVSDINQVEPVLYSIPGSVSVSYNAHLGKYLAIHSALFSEKILMHVADKPEGQWSAPVEAFTGRASAEGYNYAAREHPELARDNGQTIFITYFNPQGALRGELWFVEVKFN